MTSTPANRDQKSHKAPAAEAPSFSERFMAWWEGYDLKRPARRATGDEGAAGGEATPAAGPGLDRQGRPLWSATRLDVAEKLWGEGFVSPGSEDYLPTLVKPLGLNPAMSVLDLGAGLGGTTRLMAKQFGAWVSAILRGRSDATLRDAIDGLIEDADEDDDSLSGYERALIANVLKLRDRTVVDAMVPRADIVAADGGIERPGLLAIFARDAHSRLPV